MRRTSTNLLLVRVRLVSRADRRVSFDNAALLLCDLAFSLQLKVVRRDTQEHRERETEDQHRTDVDDPHEIHDSLPCLAAAPQASTAHRLTLAKERGSCRDPLFEDQAGIVQEAEESLVGYGVEDICPVTARQHDALAT